MFLLELNPDQSGDWIEINSQGQVIARQFVASLVECPKPADDAVFALLLPGEKVVIAAIDLPKVRPAERSRIAAFALEDQLASDPESLYVAIGQKSEETGKTTVAVTDQAYFDELHLACVAANVAPTIAMPDYLALAWSEGVWSILLHRNMAIVRTGLQSGFVIDALNFNFFIQHFIAKNPDQKPSQLTVWQSSTILTFQELDQYQIKIEIKDIVEHSPWDAAGIKTQLNLLQGKYRPKAKQSLLEKSWKICGLVVAVWIGFALVSEAVQAFYFAHQSDKLQAQVMQVYQQLFPGATSLLEPHFRTTALLKSYASASTGGAFIKLYRAAGSSLLQYPAVSPRQISFQHNTMYLIVDAENVSALNDWLNSVKAKGVTVVQKTNPGALTSVTATVTLTLS